MSSGHCINCGLFDSAPTEGSLCYERWQEVEDVDNLDCFAPKGTLVVTDEEPDE